jgi:hypothetical protein
MKTIKHGRKKLKKTLKDGKTSHTHESTKLTLGKWPYYQKQATDSIHPHQNSNVISCRNRKINTKIHLKAQKTPK